MTRSRAQGALAAPMSWLKERATNGHPALCIREPHSLIHINDQTTTAFQPGPRTFVAGVGDAADWHGQNHAQERQAMADVQPCAAAGAAHGRDDGAARCRSSAG